MPINRLGVACILTELQKQGITSSKTHRLKNHSLENASEKALENSLNLEKQIQWCIDNRIYFFRITSDMFPFADHPEVGYDLNALSDYNSIRRALQRVGYLAKAANIRLTTHPGPYTCIASPDSKVVEKSIGSIELHAKLGQLLGDPDDYCINIHVGGSYGDKAKTARRFINNFKKLSKDAQSYLTIENDDSPSGYSVKELYDLLYTQIYTPIVLDIHHWSFHNNERELGDDFLLAMKTWPRETIPKLHYSESNPNKKPTAHSEYIYNEIPDFKEYYAGIFDVMIEAKGKELALKKYRELYPESETYVL